VTILLEVIGVIVLAAAARALLPTGSTSLVAAIAAIAVAVGGAAFWLGGYASLRHLLDEHASFEGSTVAQANAAAGGQFPADEGFMAWADAHLPKTARVYLACTGHCPAEWVTFRLSPRVFVSSPAQAQYVLFYDIAPETAPYAKGKLTDVFAPKDSSGDADFVAGQEAITTLRK